MFCRNSAKFALYQDRPFERKWLCDNHCSRMRSGKRSNHCCLNSNATDAAGRQKTIVWCWKEFCGCLKLALAGATCPATSVSVVASAGSDCAVGTNKEFGCASGERSCQSWTSAAVWIGERAFWTGVSLPLKKGRRNRQNQAWKGHKVDGGGRRPRCSSGKPSDQCVAFRSATGRVDLGYDFGSSWWSRPTPKAAAAGDRRSWLRQRSAALAAAQPRHALDQPSSQEPTRGAAQRRSSSASLPKALEGGTDFRLVGQLPPLGSPIRSNLEYVSHFLPHRLCPDYLTIPT